MSRSISDSAADDATGRWADSCYWAGAPLGTTAPTAVLEAAGVGGEGRPLDGDSEAPVAATAATTPRIPRATAPSGRAAAKASGTRTEISARSPAPDGGIELPCSLNMFPKPVKLEKVLARRWARLVTWQTKATPPQPKTRFS
jgi:hypothetical protein